MAAAIIAKRTSRRTPFLILGDLNDSPDAQTLAPLTEAAELSLTDALANVQETRPFVDNPPPPSPRWTHRFRDSKAQITRFELFGHIWVGPALKNKVTDARIDRRTKKTKDGSDHDPAWITIDDIA